MLFVYYMFYDHRTRVFNKSYSFFKDIEDGKYIGIISSFSIMEYIGVAKGFFSRKMGRKITLPETDELRTSIIEFIESMGIITYDSDDLTVDPISHSCTLFSDCYSFILIAETVLGATDRKWHYLNGADALHTVFAIRSNSTHLATFDDDFKGIENNIKLVMINEVY